jgi:hypothetical protein
VSASLWHMSRLSTRKKGTELYVKVRNRNLKGKIVKHRPFYDDSVYGWKRDK